MQRKRPSVLAYAGSLTHRLRLDMCPLSKEILPAQAWEGNAFSETRDLVD